MKLSDKEALKVLAEAVVTAYTSPNNKTMDCVFCSGFKEHNQHLFDCPVLLAEEILNERE